MSALFVAFIEKQKQMDKEIRSFEVELRKAPESRTIEGRAIPFNVFSPNREGFREKIAPEAVEGVIEISDIFMLYNHERSHGFLARNNKGKGSLKIDVREDGVYFEFDAGKDDLSNYILERIDRGEINETSFAFTVREDTWVKQSDGVYERTITKFERLYDFSIVDNSYYGIKDAVGCKRYAEIQEEDRKALEAAKKAEEERQAEEDKKKEEERLENLRKVYEQLREEYKDYLKKED